MIDSSFNSNFRYNYVPVSLVSIFAAKVIPRAYMITPNQFEAELLTGKMIKSNNDVI
jgi:pyridoxine kinase